MSFRIFLIAFAGGLLSPGITRADLLAELIAYYDFEQTGAAGLANKAPGASTAYDGIRQGTLFSDWSDGSSTDPTGPGFAGKPDYIGGADGQSDRSTLLAGKALNLDDSRNEYVQIPLGIAELGNNFTISAWHALTPGDINNSNRYHLFESTNGFDISWGTANSAFTTVQSAYTYLGYIGEGPAGGFGPTGVATGPWHHVVHCITSDGTTTTLRLYVDGQFFGSRTTPTANMNFPAMVLGRHRTVETAQDRDWDGMIDEVAIWNRGLTPAEVLELYHRGSGNFALNADLAAAGKAFVAVTPNDPAMGQTFGTGIYDLNQQASIEALPALGHVFTTWQSPFTSEPAAFTHTVTGPVTITGDFAVDNADDDGDGLTNYQELITYGTLPDVADTDGDQLSDGDEVLQTQTSPLVSQALIVSYVLENLSGPGPEDTVLARNQANNTLTLRLKALASPTLQGAWGSLTPTSPGVTGEAASGDFRLQVPGTTDAKRFFRVEGVAP